MANDGRRTTLGVISLGLALGVTWALTVFMLGIVAWLFDWGVVVAGTLSSLYIGYSPSFVGAVTGAVWGFVNGLVLGVLIALFYNRFLRARRRASPPPAATPAPPQPTSGTER